jgi:hypothetical protein
MHQINLADQLYQEAQRRAVEAGFTSVDEYVADVITNDLESFDDLFTPQVIRELDQASAAAKTGGKTYSTEEVREHFHKRSEAWRADQTTH